MAEKRIELSNMKTGSVATEHPDYIKYEDSWQRVRDCIAGEDVIKSKEETYLPRPQGMSGEYADAYNAYIERAHFPLTTSYALSGALGIIIAKIPEFNVPKQLDYIIKTATKDGRSLQQLFLDTIIEIFQTGRVPLIVDVVGEINEFRFVQAKAEDFINWKVSSTGDSIRLSLAVLKESVPSSDNVFSHDENIQYHVLYLEDGVYVTRVFETDNRGKNIHELSDKMSIPTFMGKQLTFIPLFIAGSINNSYEVQPIPLISIANCSVQIYRKEADLANSEFLSCNPTLVLTGASNEDDLPNVVGSSIMIVLPNEAARVFYTKTDTAALTHVKEHIKDLYDESIQHGVAILNTRKGVESAEALRIRQATQSASIYSIYLAALNAIKQGLEAMCEWGGFNAEEIVIDAPSSLTYGIPDPAVIKQITDGFEKGVVPLPVVHKYLVTSGLLDQTVGFEEYLQMLAEGDFDTGIDEKTNDQSPEEFQTTQSKDETISEGEGVEDTL